MSASNQPTLFGYPTGLFNLFFAEMWERFSYYGMRALLVFYMIKGFLGYNDAEAYTVYGSYTAMVYMTPFFGGMLADRLLGARRAVIFGGLLMAAGHLLMTWEVESAFFVALALLIVGNGFFKPNISTMVGGLYEDGDPRRDAGFTLFYIGINLGAAMAPLLCGYVGETYGWHYGFGLATFGMMVGLAVFVVPNVVSQGLILVAAIGTAAGMVYAPEGNLLLAINAFVAVALLASAVAAFVALGRGGLSEEAGLPKDPEALKRPIMGIPAEILVYLGTLVTVPLLGLLVWSSRTVQFIPKETLKAFADSESTFVSLGGFLLKQVSTPPGLILFVVGLGATIYLLKEAFASEKIERERLFAVMVMMVFSMLFWAFFEQAGSSVSNFTDRNIDRVEEAYWVIPSDVGTTIEVELNQEQLGHAPADASLQTAVMAAVTHQYEERMVGLESSAAEKKQKELDATLVLIQAESRLTLTGLDALKARKGSCLKEAKSDAEKAACASHTKVQWKVADSNVGMGVNGTIIPASTFQSANAIFIMIFGLLFSALWTFLGQRNLEPNTPIKFGLGLLQLGLGFGAMYMGASLADERGMAAMSWLLLGYLLHTTGELCLSPVGLSMVTRLSPARLVSTVMGAWFLATAFSNYLAAIIAALTGIGHGGGGNFVPVPADTVNVYGGVFGQIAMAAILSAVIMFAMSPLLKKWMHEDTLDAPSGGGH
jgi:POT family proton-dependent oligopeptide transporter